MFIFEWTETLKKVLKKKVLNRAVKYLKAISFQNHTNCMQIFRS